jgi:hypothetical protein
METWQAILLGVVLAYTPGLIFCAAALYHAFKANFFPTDRQPHLE